MSIGRNDTARIMAIALLGSSLVVAPGCDDELLPSELDSAGAPRVISVAISSESAGEVASYCAPEADGERLSSICDNGATDVEDAPPQGWYVRLVFNELLDADRAEELVSVLNDDGQEVRDAFGQPVLRGTLVRSQPVTLRCGDSDIAYDGYYNPAGSHLTAPPGPYLRIEPVDFAATESVCTVEVKTGPSGEGGLFGVFDKDGNNIDADKRGPYSFAIASLAVVGTVPIDERGLMDEALDNARADVGVDTTVSVSFNAPIALASVAGDEVRARLTVKDAAPDDDPVEVVISVAGASVVLTPASPLTLGTTYQVSLRSGIADIEGGTLDVGPADEWQVVSEFTPMKMDADE